MPVLGLCWQIDCAGILFACADHNIKKWDLNTNQISVVGQHAQPVKDVANFTYNNVIVVVTGGWDARVKFWTWNNNTLNQIGESYVAMPIHHMSCVFPLLVTAHQDRFIHVWDLEKCLTTGQFNPRDVTESPLKFGTTAIACFADGKGFAVGSIEGRCGIKNYDLKRSDLNKDADFAFKCHREEKASTKTADVYSLNTITFNKAFNTFATIGADGHYFTWNKDSKSKYKSSKKFPAALTTADFSDDGKLFVYAIGYDYSRGFEGSKQVNCPVTLILRTPDVKTEVNKPKGR